MRFCPACGANLRAEAASERQRVELDHSRRSVRGLAVGFGGALATILAGGLLYESSLTEPARILLANLLFVATGSAAAFVLGRGAWRAGLVGRPGPIAITLGVAAGGIGFLFSTLFLEALGTLLHDTAEASGEPAPYWVPSWSLWLEWALLPALVEEWYCRGVLWAAVRRVAPAATTILVTAGLFAFLHVFNGAGFLEIPHRFALGLLLGVVRHWTKSLWPAVAGHLTNNTLAILLL